MDNKKFSGVLNFKEKLCPFTFDNFKLRIDVDRFPNDNPFSNNEKLGISYLEGKITNNPYQIFFEIVDSNYGVKFSSNGFSSITITVSVKFYLILKRPFQSDRLIISFKNNSFQKWLETYLVYKPDLDNLTNTNINVVHEHQFGTKEFLYKNKKYSIDTNYTFNISRTKIDFTTMLVIQCCSLMHYSDLYDVCMFVRRFIEFCFYRSSVSLGDIEIHRIANIVDGKKQTESIGFLFINYNETPIEPIKLDDIFDYGFIKWADICDVIDSFSDLIDKDKLYLYHLPKTRSGRFYVGYSDISLLSAAFEFEFLSLFSNYESKKMKDDSCKELKNTLLKLACNNKQKEMISNIVGVFFDTPSFYERLSFAFEKYKNVILEFLPEMFKTPEEIGKTIRLTRNKIDHGDLTFTITPEIANAFYCLRILILCIQLERLGISEDKLNEIIKPVLATNYNRL